MSGVLNLESDVSEFVEVDPTGRYGRYNEILGKGASKTVYKAFDEYEGIEVAWNQVKLYDFLQSPEDLQRLYSEIHLLKTLKHKNIMKLYTSWVDTSKRNINFITEMFTSGTLRQYRLKHKRVNIRAVKQWCRQILRGLVYLHTHDPPVIHRDLKCDNIFVNGNHGEVKIGDLGLAAILPKSHAAHCVGTPEFMAPEVYKEEYNELVDIYSFGMCVLEMVTFEYPYSECTNTAHIYQKVISGQKPDCLFKVKEPEVREFIEKCLATVSSRLSARELLNDPFLQIVDYEKDPMLIECQSELDPINIRQPFREHDSSFLNGCSSGVDHESYNEFGYQPIEMEDTGIELFEHHEDDHSHDVDITIKGKLRNDGSIFLRLRITDKEGHIRNIYFPFDIDLDTALSVATEMVAELDITDQDVIIIADMIDGEISSLVPEWNPGLGIEESPRCSNMNQNLCQNCSSNHTSVGSFTNSPSENSGAFKSPFFQCPNGCATAMHGRFEEITYQVDGSESHEAQSSMQVLGQLWTRRLSIEFSSLGSGLLSQTDEEHEKSSEPISGKGERSAEDENQDESETNDRNRNELQWELRWLKAKYLLELREVKEISSKSPTSRSSQGENSDLEGLQKTRSSISCSQKARNCEAMKGSFSVQNLRDGKSLCSSNYLLPSTLHRTTSLPVDAVYV